jgi:S-adenosylmethionine:tRNA ribosyltransferase-isomerase
MRETKQISIKAFDYPLTDDRIARYPLARRDHSKLLVSSAGNIHEDVFYNIGRHLPLNAFLISNETKVIQARLQFSKPGGAQIELFCLEPLAETADFQLAFSKPSPVVWKCMVGNSKRWKSGSLHKELEIGGQKVDFTANRIKKQADYSLVEFSWDQQGVSFAEILNAFGEVPLPPYLNRKAEDSDKSNYQTVYAKYDGSVAAPTAGLHFTGELLHKLKNEGFDFAQLTLHVGAGTFKPVSTATIGEHQMHDEKMVVSRPLLEKLIQSLDNKPVLSIGTTSMRTLESLYWIGCMLKKDPTPRPLHLKQWYPYENTYTNPLSAGQSLQCIHDYLSKNGLESLTASTALIIAPGYGFKIVNGLITNFHQPKSTLLLLVSALIGEHWQTAYQYALEHDFRFLSYGDSCLFLP